MRPGYEHYDPDGVGADNGNFLGLPRVDDPAVTFLACGYDATVSYTAGTAGGPANVLAASTQLDVCVHGVGRPWELGFAWREVCPVGADELARLRTGAERVIAALEAGCELSDDALAATAALDDAGARIADAVAAAVREELAQGRFPILVGGEHGVSLGAFRACAGYGPFGILQVDAHMDLRVAYEGFRYSHASVMHNALELPAVTHLAQVGIRDYSPGELLRAETDARVETFFDHNLQAARLHGVAFAKTAEAIVATLPQRVWVSFDIDGLAPAYCQHTGTPVPGGLGFAEAQYLLQTLAASGREVVGMDIVEVAPAPHEYEGAVAARLAYDFAARVVSARRA